jgi:glycerol-3-phosphate dehydrogenase (NAD(P)+)
VRAVVLGAGAWGTTVAILLARKGHEVTIWSRDPERARRLEEVRENERYLAGFRFPDALRVTGGAPPACDFLVGGVPAQYLRGVLERLAPSLPRAPFLSLAKGIEIGTNRLPTQVYEDVLGEDRPTAVLTGPCIAIEIARGLPTAVVVAGAEAAMFQEAFRTDRFRVYTSRDKLGAELVGALKNVMAVAAGIVDGMGLGDNAKAALLTRGIVEVARLGASLGAQPETFTGLAGFGDLFTTCVSPHGRNRGVGERIGRGERLEDILRGMSSVAEGVETTKAVVALARERGVEMPIARALHAILFEGVAVRDALGALMTRQSRAEG